MLDWKKAVLQELAHLRPDTTACPGAVAKKIGTTLRQLRPTLEEMAAAHAIVVTQKGVPVDLRQARGPVRIKPAHPA